MFPPGTRTGPGFEATRGIRSIISRVCQMEIQRPPMTDNIDTEAFRNAVKLKELRVQHRDLDDVIARLAVDPYVDQLQLRRLKKRKLQLKDMIAKLESELIPDLNA